MRRYWTEKEMELLQKFYPHVGDTIDINELSILLNRSLHSIQCKARNLNLRGAYDKENIDEEILKQLEKRCEI